MYFENDIVKKLSKILGDVLWVKRISTSSLDLETCNGIAEYDDGSRTCIYCVALNKTIFRSENFPIFGHRNCKCLILPHFNPNLRIHSPLSKIVKYLFTEQNKTRMMKSMGFSKEDYQSVQFNIYEKVYNAFNDGLYKLKTLDKYGQRVQISIKMEGSGDHAGELFNCHVGCIVWPNGILKITTPLILDN